MATESPTFRVIVADDNKPLRGSLKRFLEDDGLEVVGAAGTGRQAVEMTIALKPDVLILNIDMPSMDGLTALSAVQSAQPETAVLMYSGFSTLDYLSKAISNGASGYLVKNGAPDNVPDAVRAVAMGEMIVDRDLLHRILTAIKKKHPVQSPEDYVELADLKKLLREYERTVKPDNQEQV